MSRKLKISIVIIAAVAMLGVIIWLFMQNNELRTKNQNLENQKQSLEKQANLKNQKETNKKTEVALPGPGKEDGETPPKVPPFISDSQKKTIEESLNTMNTQPLEGYMANSVTIILAASEGMPSKTPREAVKSLDYFKNATSPWNFNLSESVLSSYKKSQYYGEYLGDNTFTGLAKSGQVVSFHFSGGKIDRIFISQSADIF